MAEANKVLIIGIDGGTFDIIKPLVNAGKLPAMGRMIREGCHGILRSTIPPVTAPAWASFLTGKNPGKHGAYDFTYRKAGSYEQKVIDRTRIKRKNICGTAKILPS